jgi:hypothetical protein
LPQLQHNETAREEKMDFQHLSITLRDGNRKEEMNVTATGDGVKFDWNNNKIKDERDFERWFGRICRMTCVKEVIVSVSDTEREFIHMNDSWEYMHETWKEEEDRWVDMQNDYDREEECPTSVYDWYYSTVLGPFIQEVIDTANILLMKKKLEGQECCVLNTPLTIENTRVFGHCKHMVCEEALKGMFKVTQSNAVACPMCREVHMRHQIHSATTHFQP